MSPSIHVFSVRNLWFSKIFSVLTRDKPLQISYLSSFIILNALTNISYHSHISDDEEETCQCTVCRDNLSAPAIVWNFYRGLFTIGKVAVDNNIINKQ